MFSEDGAAIIPCLDRHRVQYVIVGGFAALAYGVDHVTEDIDITPAGDHENLSRLADALVELQARFRVERYPRGFDPPVVIDARTLKRMVSGAFVTSCGNLDVVLEVEGVGRYAALVEGSQELCFLTQPVKECGSWRSTISSSRSALLRGPRTSHSCPPSFAPWSSGAAQTRARPPVA